MNRKVASLLFLAAAVFFAGCSSHPDSYGEAASSGSSGGTGSTGSTGSTDSSVTPAPSETDDLATFARAGIADPEFADARLVNDITFVSDENPDAFNDVF
jgi:hypothetical protein